MRTGEGDDRDELVGWHHQFNAHDLEQTPGDSEGQGSLECSSAWIHKEEDITEKLNKCVSAKSLQSRPSLSKPMVCSTSSSSVHGIPQARILEWIAMLSFRDLPDPGIEPMSFMSPALAGRFFTTERLGKSNALC